MKLHVCMPLFEEMVFVNQSMYFAMLMYRSKLFFSRNSISSVLATIDGQESNFRLLLRKAIQRKNVLLFGFFPNGLDPPPLCFWNPLRNFKKNTYFR